MAKLILAVNAGSSSLKCKLYSLPTETEKAFFFYDHLQNPQVLTIHLPEKKLEEKLKKPTMAAAIAAIIALLTRLKLVATLSDLTGVGHRVVQGADLFSGTCLWDAKVAKKVASLATLAPLHNPVNLAGYRQFAKALPPSVKEAAVFDTTLFADLPAEEKYFPIPLDLAKKYGIRRYGAHGISHEYLRQRCYQDYIKTTKGRLITVHGGAGASISAFKDGKCVATSMGLTPVGGVMMSTRSGDLDPSVVTYLMEKGHLSRQKIATILTQKSGLLGIYGPSGDARTLEKAYLAGEEMAHLAVEMFVARLADFIGAYFIKLGGLDWLVLSGSLFTNSPFFRTALGARLKESLHLTLDTAANRRYVNGREGLISSPASQIKTVVIPTDEERLIARETWRLLKAER